MNTEYKNWEMENWLYLGENGETTYRKSCYFATEYYPYKKVRESISEEELKEMMNFLKQKALELNGLPEIQKFQNKKTGEIVKFFYTKESFRELKEYTIIIFDNENALAEP